MAEHAELTYEEDLQYAEEGLYKVKKSQIGLTMKMNCNAYHISDILLIFDQVFGTWV